MRGPCAYSEDEMADAIKPEEVSWEVIEVFHAHHQINVLFKARGAEMKWYIVVPPDAKEDDLDKLIAGVSPMAIAAIEKQLEPDPVLDGFMGKKGVCKEPAEVK